MAEVALPRAAAPTGATFPAGLTVLRPVAAAPVAPSGAAASHHTARAVTVHRAAMSATRTAAAGVHWRASLNLPELRVAALSSAVHRPPPDSVPIDDETRSDQLTRSEIVNNRRSRTKRSR